MKNQKNLRLQVRLQTDGRAPGTGQNQIFVPAMARSLPLLPARKIPVAYHPAIEELLFIQHLAPDSAV